MDGRPQAQTPVEREGQIECPVRVWLLAGAGYILLALLVTWPLAKLATRCYLGWEHLSFVLWRYWWLKLVLASYAASHPGNLLGFIDLALRAGRYPETGNLTDLLLISWPLEKLAGNPLAFNLKIWLILATNGLAGFALCRDRVRNVWFAFLGGVIITANPFLFMVINDARIREGILVFILLGLMYLLRAREGGRWQDAAAAGALAGLAAAFYWFHGLFLVLIVLVAAVVDLARPPAGVSRRITIRNLVLWGLLFMAVSLPFALSYLDLAAHHRFLGRTVTWLAPFPSQLSWVPGGNEIQAINQPTWYSLGDMIDLTRHSRSLDFLINPAHLHSVSMFFLVAIPGIWLARRRLKDWGFWLVVWLGFALLSLGPYLKLGPADSFWPGNGGAGLRMPYCIAFQFVPLLYRMTQVDRSEAMVFIALGVLNAGFWAWAFQRWAGGRRQVGAWLPALLLIAIWLGYFGLSHRYPGPPQALAAPEFYQTLARGPDLGIVEFPFVGNMDGLLYYQTVHQKKILKNWCDPDIPYGVGGRASWLNERDLIWPQGPPDAAGSERMAYSHSPWSDNSLITWLDQVTRSQEGMNLPSPVDLKAGVENLHQGGYRYLVVHQDLLDHGGQGGPGRYQAVRAVFDGLFPLVLTCQERRMMGGADDPKSWEMAVYELKIGSGIGLDRSRRR